MCSSMVRATRSGGPRNAVVGRRLYVALAIIGAHSMAHAVSITSSGNGSDSLTVVDFHNSPEKIILKGIPGLPRPLVIENGKIKDLSEEEAEKLEQEQLEARRLTEEQLTRFNENMKRFNKQLADEMQNLQRRLALEQRAITDYWTQFQKRLVDQTFFDVGLQKRRQAQRRRSSSNYEEDDDAVADEAEESQERTKDGASYDDSF